jgi:putative endonuclease
MTTDLDTRLIHHNRGYNKKTKAYRPFLLIYTQEFSTRLEARNHEKYLKSGSGKEYLKENYTRT